MHTLFGLLSIYILFLGIAEFFRKLRTLWSWLFRRTQR